MILPNLKTGPVSISGCVLFLPHFPSSTTVSGSTCSTTKDLSGQGNNFTTNAGIGANAMTYQSSPPYGLSNTASSTVSLVNAATYALTNQTLAYKFKLDATPGSGAAMDIFNLRAGTGPLFTEMALSNINANYEPYAFVGNYLGSTAMRGVNTALDTNTHRLILTYNGSGNTTDANYQMYLDGTAKTVTHLTGTTGQVSGNPSCIGGRVQGSSTLNPINGKVYVIAIYNRVLSAAEITALDQMMQAL